ncbi:ABC transporter ATP-binding protein [Hyphomicrobium sp. D-2]|uniref:ABC transporter ATP-binding protein n=1 Tax=Hyphomicrobium sp. D-2 TaxID=3041621 RepID=UPI0024542696|nr:ABC transporter ATP-binding protein [Hyphomicrobium sp. D-2]MDH4981943.1 ABC transporter ATP-binding protein [Hyphomicrobium sp. D-2]
MTSLSVENLHVSLGGREIVQGVSFAAKGGEFIGLIGPNGSGKTTLLRALLGLIPSTGSISLNNVDLRTMAAKQRALNMSYVAQERDATWPLSVETVVSLGRTPHIAPMQQLKAVDRDAVEAAMREADVADMRERPITELSGGERSRVLIARALAQASSVMLADEPTSALDPAHQIRVTEIFSGLAANGRLVLMTCHDLSLAARFCTRLLLLSNGRLEADGPARQVLTAENLQRVYGVQAFFGEDEDKLVVVPRSATG